MNCINTSTGTAETTAQATVSPAEEDSVTKEEKAKLLVLFL